MPRQFPRLDGPLPGFERREQAVCEFRGRPKGGRLFRVRFPPPDILTSPIFPPASAWCWCPQVRPSFGLTWVEALAGLAWRSLRSSSSLLAEPAAQQEALRQPATLGHQATRCDKSHKNEREFAFLFHVEQRLA